jgi:hypothetical protein
MATVPVDVVYCVSAVREPYLTLFTTCAGWSLIVTLVLPLVSRSVDEVEGCAAYPELPIFTWHGESIG